MSKQYNLLKMYNQMYMYQAKKNMRINYITLNDSFLERENHLLS